MDIAARKQQLNSEFLALKQAMAQLDQQQKELEDRRKVIGERMFQLQGMFAIVDEIEVEQKKATAGPQESKVTDLDKYRGRGKKDDKVKGQEELFPVKPGEPDPSDKPEGE